MSLEYPKINTWTEANLGKFLIPLLYEGLFSFSSTKVSSFSTKVSSLFFLYGGLPMGLFIPSLKRSLLFLYEGLAMGSEKNLLWSKIFPWYNTMLPICWTPSIYWITFILIKIFGHHPSAFLTTPNYDPPFRTRRHSSLLHQTKSF
jgi:hypothetical protein